MNSPEQQLYKDTMAHVDYLQQYAYRKAAQLEVEPQLSPVYINDNLESFVLRAFVMQQKPEAVVPIVRVMQTPVDGERYSVLHVKRHVESNDDTLPYKVSFSENKRRGVDDLGAHRSGNEILKENREVEGWHTELQDDVMEILSSIQELRTDQLQIEARQGISIELRKELSLNALESAKQIFKAQGTELDKRTASQTIDFHIESEHPLNISVQFIEPLNADMGGDYFALMTATTEVAGETVALSYNVKLNDITERPQISAEVAVLGLKNRSKQLKLPGEFQYVDDVLKNIAANAVYGRVRRDFDGYSYNSLEDLESFVSPSFKLDQGIDLHALIASIYETSLK